MNAILTDEAGKLVWGETEDPQIKDDEVLLEIHAAALNRASPF